MGVDIVSLQKMSLWQFHAMSYGFALANGLKPKSSAPADEWEAYKQAEAEKEIAAREN